MIETTVSQRRELDSERQRKETQDQRRAREVYHLIHTFERVLTEALSLKDIAAKRAAVKSEISDTLRPFYCSLCEKQFQNVAQYDEHTNSYAHHHKARLRDMQANARLVNQGEVEKRKEKERKREEKELRKLAKAQGIKIAKPGTTAPAPVLVPETDTGTTNETRPSGFKNAGWATVSATLKPADPDARRQGWAAVGSARPPPETPTSAAASASRSLSAGAPTFRTGGWTSLDSTTSRPAVSPPSPPEPSAPPPPPPPTDAPPAPPLIRQESPDHNPTPTQNALFQSCATTPDSHPQPLASTSLRAPLPPPPVAPSRTGWQQWKQGNTSRRR